jgi:hypothetical protein
MNMEYGKHDICIVEPDKKFTQTIPHSIRPAFLRFPYSTLTLPLLLAGLLVPH